MVSGGSSCIKYFLFVFNLIFAISGIVSIAVGSLFKLSFKNYQHFLDDDLFTLPTILIVAGVIIFIIAFFGCCGAVRENSCMLNTFATLLIVAIIAEIAGYALGYINYEQVDIMLEKHLNSTMTAYNTSENDQKAMDVIQNDFKCCGIQGPNDWETYFPGMPLPHTCCADLLKNSTEKCTQKSPLLFNEGCLVKFENFINKEMFWSKIVGFSIPVIQIVGIGAGYCLSHAIRREYEVV